MFYSKLIVPFRPIRRTTARGKGNKADGLSECIFTARSRRFKIPNFTFFLLKNYAAGTYNNQKSLFTRGQKMKALKNIFVVILFLACLISFAQSEEVNNNPDVHVEPENAAEFKSHLQKLIRRIAPELLSEENLNDSSIPVREGVETIQQRDRLDRTTAVRKGRYIRYC